MSQCHRRTIGSVLGTALVVALVTGCSPSAGTPRGATTPDPPVADPCSLTGIDTVHRILGGSVVDGRHGQDARRCTYRVTGGLAPAVLVSVLGDDSDWTTLVDVYDKSTASDIVDRPAHLGRAALTAQDEGSFEVLVRTSDLVFSVRVYKADDRARGAAVDLARAIADDGA